MGCVDNRAAGALPRDFQDLRYALRAMVAGPGFAAVAVLSLALGIGANSAIFSLWNGVLHSSLPGVYEPEELAVLSNPGKAGGWHGSVSGDRDWLSFTEFEQLRDHARSFSGMIASQSGLANWQIRFAGGGWEVAQERLVSGGYFHVLGVKAAIGQVFTAEDDHVALPHAVISYDYWQHRFGITPQDPLTFALAALTLLVTVFCAAYWPAQRASKLDPIAALHQE